MSARRRRLRGLTRRQADRAATESLLSALAPSRDTMISAFWPLAGEFDTRSLLHSLAERGYRLCLPVVVERGRALEFRRWEPGVELLRGDFGVQTPTPAMPRARPDVVIAPFLAVDRLGYRLGYGGGYYDSSLALLRAEGPVTAVGIGYDFQYCHRVPRTESDQPIDWLVTETAVYQFGTMQSGQSGGGAIRRRGRGII